MAAENELSGKRGIPRLSISIPLEYNVANKISIYLDESGISQGTKDFSILGLCIPTPEEYSKGTLLELELKFMEVKVKTMGKVAWSGDVDKSGQYYTGVKFISIESKYLDTVIDYYINNFDWKSKEGKSFLKSILFNIFLENIS